MIFVWAEPYQTAMNVSLRVGRVRVERTYEHLIRVSDATGLPYAPCCHCTISYRPVNRLYFSGT